MLPAELCLSADRYFSKAEKVISFGVAEIDQALFEGPNGKGLLCGAVHEWLYDPAQSYPPHAILTYLAAQSLKQSFFKLNQTDQKLAAEGKLKRFHFALWIGKESWPSGYILREATLIPGAKEISLLSHCLFTNPANHKLKLWSAISALRSGCVSTVIIELKNLKLADTKRLSLAAEKEGGTVFLIRELKERSLFSAAATRWFVAPAKSLNQSLSQNVTFELTLLSSKGKRSLQNSWEVQFVKGNAMRSLEADNRSAYRRDFSDEILPREVTALKINDYE